MDRLLLHQIFGIENILPSAQERMIFPLFSPRWQCFEQTQPTRAWFPKPILDCAISLFPPVQNMLCVFSRQPSTSQACMHSQISVDPFIEDGKSTSVWTWGSSQLRHLRVVSQNWSNPGEKYVNPPVMHKVLSCLRDRWSRRYVWCKVLFMPYAQQTKLFGNPHAFLISSCWLVLRKYQRPRVQCPPLITSTLYEFLHTCD